MNTKPKWSATNRPTRRKKQGGAQLGASLHEFYIAFKDSQVQISAEQAARIKAWRFQWSKPLHKLDVVVGGAAHSSRAGMLRRFHGLMALLGQLGISTQRIIPDLEWTQPARMGALDDMPADTIWLRLYPHTRRRLAA